MHNSEASVPTFSVITRQLLNHLAVVVISRLAYRLIAGSQGFFDSKVAIVW